MLNVANLYPIHFARIVSGVKRTERRRRQRPDSRLEAIEVGEPIVLLECGSDRCIRATVRAVVRFDRRDCYVYAIRLREPRLGRAPGVRKLQGWSRRAAL